MEMQRINYSSGAPLEEKAGYSRMIKTGPFVFIGGTTAVLPDGTVYGDNSVYEQTKFILNKFIALLEEAGAHPRDVIKIKAYLTDMKLAPDAAAAYSEFFKPYKPLFTMVGISQLNRPSQLIEIELDAIIGEEWEC